MKKILFAVFILNLFVVAEAMAQYSRTFYSAPGCGADHPSRNDTANAHDAYSSKARKICSSKGGLKSQKIFGSLRRGKILDYRKCGNGGAMVNWTGKSTVVCKSGGGGGGGGKGIPGRCYKVRRQAVNLCQKSMSQGKFPRSQLLNCVNGRSARAGCPGKNKLYY